MALLAPKPASHARGALGLYSERKTVSSVASGGTGTLALTTSSAHGVAVGQLVYVKFDAMYTSGLYIALGGTAGLTLVIEGTYSGTATGYAVPMRNVPLYAGTKFDHEAQDIMYDVMRDSRYTSPSVKSLKQGILQMTQPLYLPTNYYQLIKLAGIYDKILLPAGYEKTGALQPPNGGLVFTYRMSSNFLNYDQAFVAYEEVLDREGAAHCQSEFGLKFDTASGMWFDPVEYRGKDLPVQSGITPLSYADIDGQENIPAFAAASFRMWTYAGVEIANLPAIKSFTFKNGNTLTMREDGASEGGVAGFLAGNALRDQSVEFDMEQPAVHSAFPFIDYFRDGSVLKFRLTVNSTGTCGVQVNGIFQVRQKPDRGERGSLRSMKLAGVIVQKATTDVPFEILLGESVTA